MLFTLSQRVAAQPLTDRVQRRSGIDSGEITATTPLGVTLTKGGVSSKIAAEDIRSVQFAGEPNEFPSARTTLGRGRYDTALETLRKVRREDLARDAVRQELDFLLVSCEGNLALAGQGDLKQAIQSAVQFLSANRTSYHVPEVLELQGDLYQAAGDLATSRKKYETLAKAPAAYYKARSALLVGQLLLTQQKYADALTQFDAALTLAAGDAASGEQRRSASLSRAVSLAGSGKLGEGTALVRQQLQKTALDDPIALAQGYNCLGQCYLVAGDLRQARDAYLHVDLLFAAAGGEHAEALFRLASVWKELRQPTRAEDAQLRLSENYPVSRWLGVKMN
jgi:tetratricopeptide (TPR) repeat protein